MKAKITYERAVELAEQMIKEQMRKSRMYGKLAKEYMSKPNPDFDIIGTFNSNQMKCLEIAMTLAKYLQNLTGEDEIQIFDRLKID